MHLFELNPNCSLTPRAAIYFFLSVVAVSLSVAAVFAAVGYWPVLPFAGLEVAALGAALIVSLRRGRTREFIRVDECSVVVSKFCGGTRQDYEFARPWTRVEVEQPTVSLWPSRLWLRSMGRSVEIGAFLTESERCGLQQRLVEVMTTPTCETD